jgi:tRNA threonylcarbamoyladenosine biosynthesis protein TsaB
MKTILAISCSTECASVACLHQGKTTITYNDSNNQHSETILSLVQQSLGEIDLQQVECIAVDIGPGSFMGIRTAVATAQGLAFSQNLPMYSLNSLHLLALSSLYKKQVNNNEAILTALDARRQEWYFASWQVKLSKPSTINTELVQEAVEATILPSVATPQQCLSQYDFDNNRAPILTGNVWQNPEKMYESKIDFKVFIPTEKELQHPNAAILAKIAQDNPNHWHHSSNLTPYYVRNNVADVPKT